MLKTKTKTINDRVLRLIDKEAPFGYIEAYKSLRTNVEFLASTNNYHAIMITSAGPGDGKSTVAVNLAATMADSGKRVLLMDCDLRKGSIASYLKISRRHPGITEVLSQKEDFKNAVVYKEELNIYILTVGMLPSNPAEIIGSSLMVDLIQAVSTKFDYVFIDTPPVSVVTDAAVLSRFVDGVLLVARADATAKQALALSKKNLDDVNAKILGVILNDYDNRKHSYGSNYYYSYSYRSYGYPVGEKKKKRERKKDEGKHY